MIFGFVVRRLHWMARVPGAPHLFEAFLLAWTAVFHRQRLTAMERIEREILPWPGVRLGVHRFGGTGFLRAGREFAHLHGNGLLDVHLPGQDAEGVVTAGLAQPHHLFGRSAWVSFWIQTEQCVPRALHLLRLAAESDQTPLGNSETVRKPR
jgi:hypothetical protein